MVLVGSVAVLEDRLHELVVVDTVMCSGMFHVAQKSLKMVNKCWPSNLPGWVDTMAFHPVSL